MIDGWVTRALTVSALVLRTCTDVQAGFVVCMLASIALELNAVSLLDVPAVAFARASSIPPYMLLLRPSFSKMQFRRQGPWSGPAILTPLLCLTTVLLQFSSTILVSDLRLGTLPGRQYEEDAFYDFYYNETFTEGYSLTDYPLMPRQSTWFQSPPAFPQLAEHGEKASVAARIDDTGVVLRALVPFPQTPKRESLRNYLGNAIVLDSRVSCQAPIFDNLRVNFERGEEDPVRDFDDYHAISGTVRPSRAADRLPPTSGQMIFSSAMSEASIPQSSLCSLACWMGIYVFFSGLLSQFVNSTEPITMPPHSSTEGGNLSVTWGHPYLFWDAPIEPRNLSNSTILNLTEPRQHGTASGQNCTPLTAPPR